MNISAVIAVCRAAGIPDPDGPPERTEDGFALRAGGREWRLLGPDKPDTRQRFVVWRVWDGDPVAARTVILARDGSAARADDRTGLTALARGPLVRADPLALLGLVVAFHGPANSVPLFDPVKLDGLIGADERKRLGPVYHPAVRDAANGRGWNAEISSYASGSAGLALDDWSVQLIPHVAFKWQRRRRAANVPLVAA